MLSADGATEMMLANGASFGNSIWEPYRSQVAWLLPSSSVSVDRTVSVKFRDAAGNETAVYADAITLDTVPPASPSIAIHNHAAYTTSSTVKLALFAIDAQRMHISNDPYFLVVSTVDYDTEYLGWLLEPGEGNRSVYVQFEDLAGNQSAIVSDSIIVDTLPPTGADFTIVEAPVTPLLSVFLELTAVGATEMQIAEGTCSGLWHPYSTNASYSFVNPADGLKTIAVRFRDQAGNMSACILRTITLDSTYPHITSMAPRSGYFGQEYTINGINFGAASGHVIFGGIALPKDGPDDFWSNTAVVNQVPLLAEPGPHIVTVRSAENKNSQNAVYVVYPKFESVVPSIVRSQANVVLHGKTFGTAPGTVTVGGENAPVVAWSPIAVTISVPAVLPAGTHEVRLTAGGLESPFVQQLNIVPVIDTVSPGAGTGGTLVTISGAQFGANQAAGKVLFGTTEAAIVSWGKESIQVNVPNGLAPGRINVQVLVGGIGSNFASFDYSRPWLHARSHNIGSAGNIFEVFGASLGASNGVLRVGGVPAILYSWTDTWVDTDIPGGVPKGTQAVVVEPATGEPSNVLRFHQRGSDVWFQPDTVIPQSGAAIVWTGKEVVVWGGSSLKTPYRYNPITDTWLVGSAAGAPVSRQGAMTVWTGKEVIFFGGETHSQTGGRYDPVLDTWAPMADHAIGLKRLEAVWTGTEMVIGHDIYNPATNTWRQFGVGYFTPQYSRTVWTGLEVLTWGGSDAVNSGRLFNPYLNLARDVSQTGAPSGRYNFASVWTGTEFLVWGGRNASTALSDGARYNPETDVWTPMAPAPAGLEAMEVTGVWLGDRMFVAGNGYALYDPATESWSSVTMTGAPTGNLVATGKDVLVLDTENLGGGRYDTSLESWSPVAWPESSPLGGREGFTAVWSGTEMIIWGGANGTTYYNSGTRYNPVTNRWLPVSMAGAPAPRHNHKAVWDGTRMIVWGGTNGIHLNTGGRYDPVSDSWLDTTTTGAPFGRGGFSMVWTGSEVIVWGGGVSKSGGKYDPVNDTWVSTNTADAPKERIHHSAVWAGDRMIVFGGIDYDVYESMSSGGMYFPSTNTWLPTTTSGAPMRRHNHMAVWTGNRMIVWGGVYLTGGWLDRFESTTGGGVFDPATNTWTAMTSTNEPTSVHNAAAVWTGTHLFVQGGLHSVWSGAVLSTLHNQAALYDPVANTWTNASNVQEPSARYGHTAVWNGTDIILYGGQWSSSEYLQEVYMYQP